MGSDTIRGHGDGPPTDEERYIECFRHEWMLATWRLADAQAADPVTLAEVDSVTRTNRSLRDGPESWIRMRQATIEHSLARLCVRGTLRARSPAYEALELATAPGRAYTMPHGRIELSGLVARLPDAERVVFTLSTLERLPGPAVAESLGIGEDEVRLRLRSAWAELRGLCIDRKGGAP